jgi:hypothetical protein
LLKKNISAHIRNPRVTTTTTTLRTASTIMSWDDCLCAQVWNALARPSVAEVLRANAERTLCGPIGCVEDPLQFATAPAAASLDALAFALALGVVAALAMRSRASRARADKTS